jgi:MerR family mercuric resistance operon transcriptional regulator
MNMGNGSKVPCMAHGVQIGKVARATGLSVDTIRFYEKEGLLREPERSEGGFRLYSARDIENLNFIHKAQELGFSLADIRELLLVQDERTEACTHVRDLIQSRLTAVRGKIEDLKRLERRLKHALCKCEDALGDGKAGRVHGRCPVLEEIAGSRNGRGKR